MNTKIIGIGGTNGAGKDTIGNLLAQEFGYYFVSVSDILRNHLIEQGLPPDRDHSHQLSSQWRKESGMSVLIDKALDEYKKKIEKDPKYKGLAIASLRHPGEADKVHELGGKVVWVDADPQKRYERVRVNSRGEIRSVDDNKTFDQFLSEEKHQLTHSGDETTLNMLGVKAKADIFLDNSGRDLEAFKAEAAKALGL